MMRTTTSARLGTFLLLATLAAQSQAQAPDPSLPVPQIAGKSPPSAAAIAEAQAMTSAVLAHYGALVQASYDDTLGGAVAMQKTILAFMDKPSDEGLKAARKAWIDAREFYGQTEAFRFYSGPIDDKNGPEGRINAWPMDESYVDYVKDAPNAGIINKKGAITKKALAGLNEKNGEENIATGWHAIEFLLWGQDLSLTGPGERSFEDYVDGKRPNAERRRLYLKTVTELLVDDLTFLSKAWAPGAKNYRAKFEKGGMESVRKMFVGLGSLSRGELAGERLEVALASQSQEDEHSCFSDNTHRDVVNNAKGIQNVWLGTYKRADGSTVQGASLNSMVTMKNSALANNVTRRVHESIVLAEDIRAPFDREIVGGKSAPGRIRIQKTIDSLIQQSKDLIAAANVLGISAVTLDKP